MTVTIQDTMYIRTIALTPINLQQALQSFNTYKLIDPMNEEIKSIHENDIWALVQLHEGLNHIGCKWIFKTKRDSKGIRRVLLQKDLLNVKASIIMKPFLQYQ